MSCNLANVDLCDPANPKDFRVVATWKLALQKEITPTYTAKNGQKYVAFPMETMKKQNLVTAQGTCIALKKENGPNENFIVEKEFTFPREFRENPDFIKVGTKKIPESVLLKHVKNCADGDKCKVTTNDGATVTYGGAWEQRLKRSCINTRPELLLTPRHIDFPEDWTWGQAVNWGLQNGIVTTIIKDGKSETINPVACPSPHWDGMDDFSPDFSPEQMQKFFSEERIGKPFQTWDKKCFVEKKPGFGEAEAYTSCIANKGRMETPFVCTFENI